MGEKTDNTVPYIVYESMSATNERHIKRLVIALIISVVLLFVSNALWLYYESQFVTVSYEQDGEGINNVNIGEQGDLWNEPNCEN